MSTDCIVLAAGLSARMGQNKLTLDLGGKTVIERCIDSFYESCEKIVVVTGAYHKEIRRLLKPYSKVHTTYNATYVEGMMGSIKEGIRYVGSERFFIIPGDYPLIKADTVMQIAKKSGQLVFPVCRGRRGYPILLERAIAPAILYSSAANLRDCLAGFPAVRQECYVSDVGILKDINTLEEYKAIMNRF